MSNYEINVYPDFCRAEKLGELDISINLLGIQIAPVRPFSVVETAVQNKLIIPLGGAL